MQAALQLKLVSWNFGVSAEMKNMEICDNELCKVKWFHIDCLRIEKVPKGKWFCPECTKERRGKKIKR